MSSTSENRRGAPAWVAGLFLAGLVVLFIGQRVVVEWELAATGATLLGVLFAVAATALRFAPGFRTSGEHARIGNLLVLLQGLGLLGVAIYFASTPKELDQLALEGEARELVSSIATVAFTTLVAVSACAVLFAEVALNPMRDAAVLESRRVRAAALSGSVLAIAASYGSLFVYSAAQTEAQADFSYFKTSEPGEATVKLLQKISDPIEVVAFFPEVSEVRKEVKSYLAELQAQAPNLKFQFVDRYLQPKLAKEHKVVADGNVVLNRGESSETLRLGAELDNKTRTQLRTLDQDFHAAALKLLRTKRIAYATIGHGELNDKDLGAGRDEGRSSEIFFDDLERQNYRVKDLGLSQGLATGIPDDAGIVMILGPIHPFAAEEIESVRKYVDRGGKVLLALDTDAITNSEVDSNASPTAGTTAAAATTGKPPAAPSGPRPTATAPTAGAATAQPAPGAAATAPGTAATAPAAPAASKDDDWRVALAEAVGVEFVPASIADETKFLPVRNNASAHAVLFTNRFSSHASVSTLSRHSTEAVVILNGSSHLKPLEGAPGKAEVTLRSFPSAFQDDNGNFTRDDKETAEAFNLAIALTRAPDPSVAKPAEKKDDEKPEPKTEDEHGHGDESGKDGKKDAKTEDALPDEMRAFVIADADVFSDLVMFRFRTNRFLAADAVRWLGGEESLAGEFESEEDVRVEQTKQADMTWFYSSIFGVPFLVLAGGLFTSHRLRKGGAK